MKYIVFSLKSRNDNIVVAGFKAKIIPEREFNIKKEKIMLNKV